jgi:hypothetical protein
LGISTSGIIRAEGNHVTSVLPTDEFVIQRLGTGVTNSYFSPYIATVSELFGGSGLIVTATGSATLVGGTVSVAMASISASAIVLLTEQSATPLAVGAVVTAGTGFTITSTSNTDTSVVAYQVLDV